MGLLSLSHFTPPLSRRGGWGVRFPYLQPHRVLYVCLTDQLQVTFAERTDPYILSGAYRGDDGRRVTGFAHMKHPTDMMYDGLEVHWPTAFIH